MTFRPASQIAVMVLADRLDAVAEDADSVRQVAAVFRAPARGVAEDDDVEPAILRGAARVNAERAKRKRGVV
jgi:hypothetical protein